MIKEGEQLAAHTTLKVGGRAERFAVVTTREELVTVVSEAKNNNWSVQVFSGGSNILVPDSGVAGLVIQNQIKGIQSIVSDDIVTVRVGAGEVFDDLVAETVKNNWWGLENLSHIPGSVGATPIQNVGAYGVEVKDLISEVEVFNSETMEFEIFTNEACQFRYRNSFFKSDAGKKYIVTQVTFDLSVTHKPILSYRDLQQYFTGKNPTQSEIRDAVIEIRSGKFPNWHEVGTAGSFFKNPIVSQEQYQQLTEQFPELPGFAAGDGHIKVPLGWILDKVLQLKGVQEGNVGTYKGQALVLVNHGGATASEIQEFANRIVAEIKQKLDVTVEWEVTKW